MELGVAERLRLLSVLPEKGNFITLKIVRELRETLSFDEAELTSLGFVTKGPRLEWNVAAEKIKDVPMGPQATDLIRSALKDLDDREALDAGTSLLYEKFVLGNGLE